MRTLTSLFAGAQTDENKEKTVEKQTMESQQSAFKTEKNESIEKTSEQTLTEPVRRRVIQAPVWVEEASAKNSDEILIKAQPTANGDQCLFMVNRPLFKGHSWWFPTFESAEGSPLAEALFVLDGVANLLVDHSTMTVTRNSSGVDWLTLAKEIGATVRGLLQANMPLMAERIVKEMPSEENIRAGIQGIIDAEVNPGVAGHGGKISLISVKGNSVTIQMGGGCQGCSAADVTLKMGIHNSFRKAVPAVGAIYDETDHGAGSNPYFS